MSIDTYLWVYLRQGHKQTWDTISLYIMSVIVGLSPVTLEKGKDTQTDEKILSLLVARI